MTEAVLKEKFRLKICFRKKKALIYIFSFYLKKLGKETN